MGRFLAGFEKKERRKGGKENGSCGVCEVVLKGRGQDCKQGQEENEIKYPKECVR